jgi:hypothetical protein
MNSFVYLHQLIVITNGAMLYVDGAVNDILVKTAGNYISRTFTNIFTNTFVKFNCKNASKEAKLKLGIFK